jgi:hypothetical protein
MSARQRGILTYMGRVMTAVGALLHEVLLFVLLGIVVQVAAIVPAVSSDWSLSTQTDMDITVWVYIAVKAWDRFRGRASRINDAESFATIPGGTPTGR